MASSAYLSWLQKREFKVLRSPSMATRPDKSPPSPSKTSKTATVASFLPRRQCKLPEQKNASVVFSKEQVKNRLSTARKRPHGYMSHKEAATAVEMDKIDKEWLIRGGESATTAVTKAKSEVPGTKKQSEKTTIEDAKSGEPTGKKRRVDTETNLPEKRRRRDDEEKSSKDESGHKQMERRLAAILGESQYWQAVDRFSHLD